MTAFIATARRNLRLATRQAVQKGGRNERLLCHSRATGNPGERSGDRWSPNLGARHAPLQPAFAEISGWITRKSTKNSGSRSKGRSPEIALKIMVIIGIFLLSGGCALTTRDMVMYHSFNYPSPPREQEPGVPETVMVYNFLLDPTVEMHALAISYSKDGQTSIMKHRWQENPADMITELVLRDLANAGPFEKAVDQLSTTRYRYALEGVIHNLQGVVRNGKSSALIEIEATLVDFDAPPGKNKNVLKKTYRIEIPSTDDKPESMVAALNLGLRDFSAQLRTDIRTALPRRLPKTKAGERRTRLADSPR